MFEQTLRSKIVREEISPDIDQVDLTAVVFPGEANFEGRVLKKHVSFAHATFTREARFRDTVFMGMVSFGEAKFDADALFLGARFGGTASFGSAEFSRAADFVNAEMAGDVDFWGTRFRREALFASARFHRKADFWGATFEDEADFSNTALEGETHFRDAEFAKRSDFSASLISGNLYFIHTSFRGSDGRAASVFRSLVIESVPGVRFEGVDLSKVSFLRTDVSQLQFVACKWARMVDPLLLWPFPFAPPRPLTHSRSAIWDEVELDERRRQGEDISAELPLVADQYRQLRINLEARRQEVAAGDFYIGQMEMRRRDHRDFDPIYRGLLGFYRLVAMYGQSYWRPFVIYAFILAPLFALAYWVLGEKVAYADGLFVGLTAGALLQGLVPTGIESWDLMVLYLNMLADIALLGLILLALGRRFRR